MTRAVAAAVGGPHLGQSGYVIIADAQGAVRFGTTWPIRVAEHDALELSRQINGAVLLVNRLREVFWH